MDLDMNEALALRRKEEAMLRFAKFSHEDALTEGPNQHHVWSHWRWFPECPCGDWFHLISILKK